MVAKGPLATASHLLGIGALVLAGSAAAIMSLAFGYPSGKVGGDALAPVVGMFLTGLPVAMSALAVLLGVIDLARIPWGPERGFNQQAVRGVVCGVLAWLTAGSAFLLPRVNVETERHMLAARLDEQSLPSLAEGPCGGLVAAFREGRLRETQGRFTGHAPRKMPPPSCVCHAVAGDNGDVVRWMIEHGSDPNTRACQHGGTPLTVAVGDDNAPLVGYLLQHGADPNLRGADLLPLALAARYAGPEVATVLLSHGADIRARVAPQMLAEREGTALHVAMRLGDPADADRRASVVRALLEHGADPVATDDDGRTPLHLAADTGFYQGAETLLSYCAERSCARRVLEIADSSGSTPLEVARRAQARASSTGDATQRPAWVVGTLEDWQNRLGLVASTAPPEETKAAPSKQPGAASR